MIYIHNRDADLSHASAHDVFSFLLAADFERRSIDHESAFSTGRPAGTHRSRLPDVLADIQANAQAIEFEYGGLPPCREISLLIKHRIVWQQLLAIARDDLAIQQHGAGIVDLPVVVFRKPEENGDAKDLVPHPGNCGLDIVAQAGMKQQVLGWIPANAQFREYDDIGAVRIARALRMLDDLRRVPRDIANDEIDLGERNFDGVGHSGSSSGADDLLHLRAQLGRRTDSSDASSIQGLELVFRRALTASNNGAGVTHAFAWRCCDTGNVGNNRLRDIALDELSRRLFVGPANLANHDDAVGFRICFEELEAVDKIHATHRVAADTNTRGLAETICRRLIYGFVRKCARTGYDANAAFLVDEARHDTDLALFRRDDARAVRANQPAVIILQRRLDLDHVVDRNTFGNANNQTDSAISSFEDRIGCKRRWHVNHADIRACGGNCVTHRVVHRHAEVLLAATSRRYASDDLGAVLDALFSMEGPLVTRDALAEDLAVFVDQNTHSSIRQAAAATTFLAASVRSSAAMMSRPLFASSSRPVSTLVPSRRTTTGTFTPTSFTALMMPSAIRSQRTIPPKMLTRIASTLSFVRISLNAAATRSAVAPPPTSRKLAGSPPWSLMRSIVAIARPAPFTMHAILPSSDT